MRDLLGNIISEGSLVWWISKQLPMRVVRIEGGGVIVNQHPSPTHITLEISIPVRHNEDGSETQFTDFLCTMNPDAERILDKMLEGQRRQ